MATSVVACWCCVCVFFLPICVYSGDFQFQLNFSISLSRSHARTARNVYGTWTRMRIYCNYTYTHTHIESKWKQNTFNHDQIGFHVILVLICRGCNYKKNQTYLCVVSLLLFYFLVWFSVLFCSVGRCSISITLPTIIRWTAALFFSRYVTSMCCCQIYVIKMRTKNITQHDDNPNKTRKKR